MRENFDPDVTSHTCDKCQAQFEDAAELTSHQKDCLKPVMLLFKENQENSESKSDLLNSFNSDNVDNDDVPDESDSNIANNFTAGEEVDSANEESQSNFDTMDSECNRSVDDHDEFDTLKPSELSEKIKSNPTAADLKAYMRQLSTILPTLGTQASSNVMLEPLEATKAAVAQFAENNPDQEKDVSKLHAALFNLQQQQLMQLQLIQQLQQQLVSSGAASNPFSPVLMGGQLPTGVKFPGLNLTMPNIHGSSGDKSTSSKSSSRNESPTPKLESPNTEEKPKPLSSRSSSPVTSERCSPETSSLMVPEAGELRESPVALLMSAASKAGSHSTPSSSSSSLLALSRSGSKGKDPLFASVLYLCPIIIFCISVLSFVFTI